MSFIDSFKQLTQLLIDHPGLAQPSIAETGERLISIYLDERFQSAELEQRRAMRECLTTAAEDFSSGAVRLSRESACTFLTDGKFFWEWETLGSKSSKTLVLKISLRQKSAFGNWRKETEAPEMSQDEINGGVYFLAKTVAGLG